jgi:hypothetical protein
LDAISKDVVSLERSLVSFEESFKRETICNGLEVIKRRVSILESAMKVNLHPNNSLANAPSLQRLAYVVEQWSNEEDF